MHLSSSNHATEDDTEFRRRHGARKGHHHLPASIDVLFVGLRGLDQFAGIEVAVVRFKKTSYVAQLVIPRWGMTVAES